MKRSAVGIGICAALVFGLVLSPGTSSALTCKKTSFAKRVEGSKNIVVAELVKFGRTYPRKLEFRVVKVLKNGGSFGAKITHFQVTESRYVSLGIASPRKGQLFLVFYENAKRPWTCGSPILLR